MPKIEKPKFKITFSGNGSIICDSYDKRESGVYWVNGSIQGYSTNDQIKRIDEFHQVKNENK